MRFCLLALAPMFLIGCDNEEDEVLPVDVAEAFPFDGAPTWEFMNANQSVSYKLIGILDQTRNDDDEIFTIRYTKMCMAVDASCVDGELVRAISWSNDPVEGVAIHSVNNSGVQTEFDPPLALAASEMYYDDTMITETAGFTWTSTLVTSEECPVAITGGIDADCLRISLSDGGMGETNAGLVGEYWAVAGYGVVAMDVAADQGRWELVDYDECSDDCY